MEDRWSEHGPEPKGTTMVVPPDREKRQFGIVAVVALALFGLGVGTMLFFARQDLGSVERELASVRTELRAERELVEDLEAQASDLEGEANAAQIEAEGIRATAAQCVTEVLKATTASLNFRYSTALFWLRESRHTCQPIIEGQGGVL
jgi:uncharacterized protein (DUF3084 family)